MTDSSKLSEVLLGLGSSQGDREDFLKKAVKQLRKENYVTSVSSVYETAPVGPAKNTFLNCCMILKTSKNPDELLAEILLIEKQNDRTREVRWGDRTLDVDILLWIDPTEAPRIVQKNDLSIPHPRMLERSFVMTPALEIAANWVHPIKRCPLADLASTDPELEKDSLDLCLGSVVSNSPRPFQNHQPSP